MQATVYAYVWVNSCSANWSRVYMERSHRFINIRSWRGVTCSIFPYIVQFVILVLSKTRWKHLTLFPSILQIHFRSRHVSSWHVCDITSLIATSNTDWWLVINYSDPSGCQQQPIISLKLLNNDAITQYSAIIKIDFNSIKPFPTCIKLSTSIL